MSGVDLEGITVDDPRVFERLLTTGTAMGVRVMGDSYNRFRVTPTGVHEWGPGNGTYDANLYRVGPGAFKSDHSFDIVGVVRGFTAIETRDTGDATKGLIVTSPGATAQPVATGIIEGWASGFGTRKWYILGEQANYIHFGMEGGATHLALTGGNFVQDAGTYHNFGGANGSGGYGFRDNAGVMEVKHTALGTWQTVGSGGGGTVTGSGTTGTIPKWASATALGDSIITEAAGVITITGSALNLPTVGSGILVGDSVAATLRLLSGNVNGAYIQSGISNVDAAAVLNISRRNTASTNILAFNVYATTSYFSGNVGIGTTGPQATLEVSADIDGMVAVYRANSTANTIASIVFANNNSTPARRHSAQIAGMFTTATAGSEVGAMALYTRSGGAMNEVMRLTGAGNVGIGTWGVTPYALLQVGKSVDTDPSLTHQTAALVSFSNSLTDLVITMDQQTPFTASIQHRHTTVDGAAYPIAINPLGGLVTIPSLTATTFNTTTATVANGLTVSASGATITGNVNVTGNIVLTNTIPLIEYIDSDATATNKSWSLRVDAPNFVLWLNDDSHAPQAVGWVVARSGITVTSFNTGPLNVYHQTGHIGLGTTSIAAWHTNYRALQLGSRPAIMWSNTGSGVYLLENAWYDGTNYNYRTANTAAMVELAGANFNVRLSNNTPVLNSAIGFLTVINMTTSAVTITPALTASGGFTVSAGGIAVTGNSTITGNLNVTNPAGNIIANVDFLRGGSATNARFLIQAFSDGSYRQMQFSALSYDWIISANDTSAYQFKNAGGVVVARIDTTNSQLVLGSTIAGQIQFSNAFNNSGYIIKNTGTTGTSVLQFTKDAVDVMTLTNAGYAGIGAVPQARFHITETSSNFALMRLSNTANGSPLKNWQIVNSAAGALIFYSVNDAWTVVNATPLTLNNAGGITVSGNSAITGTLLVTDEISGTATAGAYLIKRNGIATGLYIESTGDPTIFIGGGRALTITASNVQAPVVITARPLANDSGYITLNAGNAANAGYVGFFKHVAGGTPARIAYLGFSDGTTDNNLGLTLEASANFNINGGNVGIGVTGTPASKLTVAGLLTVTTGGARITGNLGVNSTGSFPGDIRGTTTSFDETNNGNTILLVGTLTDRYNGGAGPWPVGMAGIWIHPGAGIGSRIVSAWAVNTGSNGTVTYFQQANSTTPTWLTVMTFTTGHAVAIANGLTVSAGGIVVTGNSSITGTLGVSSTINVTSDTSYTIHGLAALSTFSNNYLYLGNAGWAETRIYGAAAGSLIRMYAAGNERVLIQDTLITLKTGVSMTSTLGVTGALTVSGQALFGGGASTLSARAVEINAVNAALAIRDTTAGGHKWLLTNMTSGSGDIALYDESLTLPRFYVNAAGNFGFDTTDVESFNTNYRGINLGLFSAIMWYNTAGASALELADNAYISSAGAWTYRDSLPAADVTVSSGTIILRVSTGTPTINTGITWVNALTVAPTTGMVTIAAPGNAASVLKVTQTTGSSSYTAFDFSLVSETYPAIGIRKGSEAQSRWFVDGAGKMNWGPGVSTVTDVSLERSAAGNLKIGGHLGIGVDPGNQLLNVEGSSIGALAIIKQTNATNTALRVEASASGNIELAGFYNAGGLKFSFTTTAILQIGVSSADKNWLYMRSGVEPSGASSSTLQLYSYDIGGTTGTLGFWVAQAVGTETALTADRSLQVRINGVTYRILLHT